jgi:hypothetical protein
MSGSPPAPTGFLAQLEKDAQAAGVAMAQQQQQQQQRLKQGKQQYSLAPGAVGVLPEAVQLYTALSRLQEVAVAVLELLP